MDAPFNVKMRAALRKVIYILFHFRLVLCYTFSGPPPQDNPNGFKYEEKKKRGRKCHKGVSVNIKTIPSDKVAYLHCKTS